MTDRALLFLAALTCLGMCMCAYSLLLALTDQFRSVPSLVLAIPYVVA